MDLSLEDHSPVEEVPVEQTRVYQNQPGNQNVPVQVNTQPTPKTPAESAVLQKTRLNQNVQKKPAQNRPRPDETDQNWIDEDQTPTQRVLSNVGFDGNGAIWVTEATEQPGFLFPVIRTSTLPTIRRQITEEASLAITPHVVIQKAPILFLLNLMLKQAPDTNLVQACTSLLFLQSSDQGAPDQAGDGGLPSPQSDLYTPPVEDIQVTDVFYEDLVSNPPLETTDSAVTVLPAAVLPGQV